MKDTVPDIAGLRCIHHPRGEFSPLILPYRHFFDSRGVRAGKIDFKWLGTVAVLKVSVESSSLE